MTQHSSLKGSQVGGKFRSVLKRYEKIKELTEKETWDAEKDSVFHLPKVKRIKFKIRKAKAPAEAKEAGPAEEAAAGAKKQTATNGGRKK